MSASLDHLYMLVSDLERSVAFYERLGFTATRWGDYVRLEGPNGLYIGMEEGTVAVGGSIELDSVPGRTAFHIWLPLAAAGPQGGRTLSA